MRGNLLPCQQGASRQNPKYRSSDGVNNQNVPLSHIFIFPHSKSRGRCYHRRASIVAKYYSYPAISGEIAGLDFVTKEEGCKKVVSHGSRSMWYIVHPSPGSQRPRHVSFIAGVGDNLPVGAADIRRRTTISAGPPTPKSVLV